MSDGCIRRCQEGDLATMFAIINAAAEAYRGVIPADRWHEPYMPLAELRDEVAAGVEFWSYVNEGALLGVMGLQDRGDVYLIRHAYVLPERQGQGIGGALLAHLMACTDRPVLIGTWAAATWAIAFYEKHGFRLVTPEDKTRLLQRYWRIPARQVETSVVLADGRWFAAQRPPPTS